MIILQETMNYIYCLVNYSIQSIFTLMFIIKIIMMNKNKVNTYPVDYDNIELREYQAKETYVYHKHDFVILKTK